MSGQVVGYVRVSSVAQNTARQVAALGEVVETFTDRVSGKSRGDRPALATMLRHVRRGSRRGTGEDEEEGAHRFGDTDPDHVRGTDPVPV